ncbi:hypothetical protein EA462_01810 [Natrarchaeobius halalkaliphilus]|uniref:DUF1102 domain-containing protein n=1 Tax=Natrarchaeobius halalkaliphilus TaxID=1679091 RepID=A0A3N6P9N8_9EURY|nr:hypothetical protein [Natrarchaeobius halalkaliphilus]RQG92975.1 hypothetical protein EA462_01810 [Natrarchaeobius halalkaliphilus]
MRLTRRNAILGLGTLAAGTGAIAATGAFDTVEADREVSVEFSDDSDATLTMVPNPDREGNDNFGEGETLDVSQTDGEIQISLNRINRNARVTFSDLVQFTNNGSQDITSLSFSLDQNEGSHGTLEVDPDDENILEDDLDVGDNVVGLGLVVDTLGEDLPPSEDIEMDGTITITANTAE